MTAGGAGQPVILRLAGDVDALTQADYQRAAEKMLSGARTDRLIVDMSDLVTIDSSGLGLLVHLQSLTRENNIGMVLTNVPPRAGALLKRTGLDRVFEIDAS